MIPQSALLERFEAHPAQIGFWRSRARYQITAAGRRSGKTAIAKRKGVEYALATKRLGARVLFTAPTRPQVKDIYWEDLLTLLEPYAVGINLTELRIDLPNGAHVQLYGLERPQRIEGAPIDWLCMDEPADVKPEAWRRSIRPALNTKNRLGRCVMVGKPRVGTWWHEIAKIAMVYRAPPGVLVPRYSYHNWPSVGFVPDDELDAERQEMSEEEWETEYGGKWRSYQGAAYAFDAATHCFALRYMPDLPIVLCFDFNVSPGVCAIIQEQPRDRYDDLPGEVNDRFTAVIDEVHIPRDSTTGAVCRKLVQKLGDHKGRVFVYGDATGGQSGTAQETGSDWQQVRRDLSKKWKGLRLDVPHANPRERARRNRVNARLKTEAGVVSMLVDPRSAPNVVRDFEGVQLLEGGSGEIDKKGGERAGLTHLSEAIGYYVYRKFPGRQVAAVMRW